MDIKIITEGQVVRKKLKTECDQADQGRIGVGRWKDPRRSPSGDLIQNGRSASGEMIQNGRWPRGKMTVTGSVNNSV
jgi:hypothetical protein